MRTTLTLDDDVAAELQRRAPVSRGGFKGVLNETLRRGLAAGDKPVSSPERFVVKAKACGFLPGIDPLKLNQLVDAVETEDFVAGHGRKQKRQRQ